MEEDSDCFLGVKKQRARVFGAVRVLRQDRTQKNQNGKMDDYMFKFFVDECRVVEEKTSYIEIFNYSVSCDLDIRSFRPR